MLDSEWSVAPLEGGLPLLTGQVILEFKFRTGLPTLFKEIVADRGYEGLVTTGEWESACRLMETEFRAGLYQEGALAGIHAVSTLIERHFPPERRDVNELPDRPVIL